MENSEMTPKATRINIGGMYSARDLLGYKVLRFHTMNPEHSEWDRGFIEKIDNDTVFFRLESEKEGMWTTDGPSVKWIALEAPLKPKPSYEIVSGGKYPAEDLCGWLVVRVIFSTDESGIKVGSRRFPILNNSNKPSVELGVIHHIYSTGEVYFEGFPSRVTKVLEKNIHSSDGWFAVEMRKDISGNISGREIKNDQELTQEEGCEAIRLVFLSTEPDVLLVRGIIMKVDEKIAYFATERGMVLIPVQFNDNRWIVLKQKIKPSTGPIENTSKDRPETGKVYPLKELIGYRAEPVSGGTPIYLKRVDVNGNIIYGSEKGIFKIPFSSATDKWRCLGPIETFSTQETPEIGGMYYPKSLIGFAIIYNWRREDGEERWSVDVVREVGKDWSVMKNSHETISNDSQYCAVLPPILNESLFSLPHDDPEVEVGKYYHPHRLIGCVAGQQVEGSSKTSRFSREVGNFVPNFSEYIVGLIQGVSKEGMIDIMKIRVKDCVSGSIQNRGKWLCIQKPPAKSTALPKETPRSFLSDRFSKMKDSESVSRCRCGRAIRLNLSEMWSTGTLREMVGCRVVNTENPTYIYEVWDSFNDLVSVIDERGIKIIVRDDEEKKWMRIPEEW